MIHVFDDDPRQVTDAANYPLNHGSFAAVAININKSLKKMGFYADPDDAEWVGACCGLDTAFKYKDKKNFIIHVWEATSMPIFVYHNAINMQQRIFGLSNQITKLWHYYNRDEVKTIYGGCDTEFWHQTKDKNKDVFQFCHVNSSNVRSGLDITVQAFATAFFNTKGTVKLIIKDTNPNDESSILQRRIEYFVNYCGVDIEYRTGRVPSTELRDLYSESHVTLNLLRATSFGMPLLDCSACNSLCLTGDIAPTNELIRPEYGVLLKPKGLVPLMETAQDLAQRWGLLNCYGNFHHIERPFFYDFSVPDYAQLLNKIYNSWSEYSKIDTRTPIVQNWSWDKAASTLKNELYGV